jgi:thiamine transport system substrate-binding protein
MHQTRSTAHPSASTGRTLRRPASAVALALTLAGCTLAGDDEPDDAATGTAGNRDVVLVTHDSFVLPDELVAEFTAETGYEVEVRPSGDAGSMTNTLVLTEGSPVGDAVFGIDTTFASRALDADVLAPHGAELPEGAEQHALEDAGADLLVPVDYGDVCVNIDDTWFEAEGIDPPQTLEDLAEPAYRGLFVTPGASTSSPGLAFLLATVGHFGEDGWQDYWADLVANDVLVTSGWSDAYSVDFTAGGGEGDRPVVLSYASSPPFTIPEGADEPTTSALLDTCFRQVEYAGVLAGAANPEGAQALVQWLLSEPVQAAVPDSMYVYPADPSVPLPEVWAQWAEVAEDPVEVAPEEIEERREEWVREWADIATG